MELSLQRTRLEVYVLVGFVGLGIGFGLGLRSFGDMQVCPASIRRVSGSLWLGVLLYWVGFGLRV